MSAGTPARSESSGQISAVGWPLTVTVVTSPAAARRMAAGRSARSSRTPISVIRRAVYRVYTLRPCHAVPSRAKLPSMNFAFTEEQEELRKTVRAFMESKSSEATVRELMETETGYDPAVWSQMGEQMGLQGLAIPEEFGGSGYSFVELGIVLEEMGRSLLAAPFFSTAVLAAQTLIHSGDDNAKKTHLPGHRQRRDDRDARVHRAVGQVGRGGDHDRGHGIG